MKSPERMALLAIAFLLCVGAGAEEQDTTIAAGVEAPVAGAATIDESVLQLDTFDDSTALSDEELGGQRARENLEIHQVTINDQDQDGDVTDNVAVGNTNGDNLISGEAFSNSSGFLSTVQNTGNNVLIQNSTIINVSVDTPAAE